MDRMYAIDSYSLRHPIVAQANEGGREAWAPMAYAK